MQPTFKTHASGNSFAATQDHPSSLPAEVTVTGRRNLKTFNQFCRDNQAFTEGGMRWLKFCSAPGRKDSRGQEIPVNGFASIFVSVGRRVYVDEDRFFEILRAQSREAGHG